jgi:hypothetical protein
MRRHLGFGLLTAFLLALPVSAADEKKKGDNVLPTIDSDKLTAGDYTGKLLTVPGTDGSFTLEIQVPKLVLKNPNQAPSGNKYANVIREQQRITQLQNQLAHSRNTQQYLQRYNQLQNAIAQLERSIAQAGLQNPYKVTYDKKDVTFHAAEDYKVRRLELPQVFDDKGEPKKYTEAEKKELKGKDKNLPGYEAKPDDLSTGQIVKVTLAKNKKKPEAKDKEKPEAKDKEKADKADKEDKADKKDDDPKMVVTLILILSDPETKDTPKREKKKN